MERGFVQFSQVQSSSVIRRDRLVRSSYSKHNLNVAQIFARANIDFNSNLSTETRLKGTRQSFSVKETFSF